MKRGIVLATAVAALVLTLASPRDAQAHAALVSSEPGSNSFLKAAPAELVMRFNEPLDTRASSVELISATGERLALGAPQFSDGNRAMSAQPPQLGPGVYSILWLNVSTIDGHGIRGSIPFTILNPDGTLPAGTALGGGLGDPDPSPLLDATVVRALSLVALIVVAAGAFVPLFAPGGTTVSRANRFALVTAGGAGLLLAGTFLSLPGILDTYSGRSLRQLLLETPAGGYFVARAGLCLLIAVCASFYFESPRRAAATVAACIAIYVWCFTATSHAAAASGSGWAMSFDLAHGVAAVYWLGAVLSLGLLVKLGGGHESFRPLMARMALVASACVYLLLATGVLGAAAQIDALGKLTGTRYGVTLLLKLGLAVPLLAIAFYNSRWGRRSIAGEPPGNRRFVLSTTAEVGAGVAVLIAAAFLTQSVVPRSIPSSDDDGVRTVSASGLDVTFQAAPNVVGLNSFRVDLKQAGQPVGVDRVRLTFRPRDGGATATTALEGAGTGIFLGAGAFLSQPGEWDIDIEVRRTDTDDAILPISVKPAEPLAVRSSARWGNPAAGLDAAQTLSLAVLALGLALMYTGVTAGRVLGDWRPRAAGSLGAVVLLGVGVFGWRWAEDEGASGIRVSEDPLSAVNLRFERTASGRTVIVGEITNAGSEADWILSGSVLDADLVVDGALSCSEAEQATTRGMPIPLPAGVTTVLTAAGCRLELTDPVQGSVPLTLVLNSGRRVRELVEVDP